jgi:alkylation response protein AidB-like acyl-CoA dehydrogenase
MIRDSALAWLAENYDFRQREASLHRDGGSALAWSAFARMGWLGLPLSESVGGAGAGLLERCVLLNSLGRHLVVEPVGPVLEAADLLSRAGSPEQQRAWLPGLIQGEHRVILVHSELRDLLPWSRRTVLARGTDHGWILDGAKRAVMAAPGAKRWIVSAHNVHHENCCLFLLDPLADGVSIETYDTTDGARAADIVFRQVAVGSDALLPLDDASRCADSCLNDVLAQASIADCWYATGAMRAAFEQTVDYVQQRRQFGQPLSDLQVVQHRLAEMAVECAEAEAACELAALRADRSANAALAAASMARSKVVRSSRYVSQQSVQLHGAMGVCEELSIAATFRALATFSRRGGDAIAHASAYGLELLTQGAFAKSQVLD